MQFVDFFPRAVIFREPPLCARGVDLVECLVEPWSNLQPCRGLCETFHSLTLRKKAAAEARSWIPGSSNTRFFTTPVFEKKLSASFPIYVQDTFPVVKIISVELCYDAVSLCLLTFAVSQTHCLLPN